MKKAELLAKMNTKIMKMKMGGKKYSPEILLLLGIAGAVTGTVLACVATTKLPEVKAKREEALEDMHARLDGTDAAELEANLPAVKKETTSIYVKSGLRYAGLYAPAVLVSGVSLSCLVFSNIILRKRLIGATAAYAALSTSFREYRDRVTERFGDEIEKEIRYNIKPQEITTTSVDTKGKEKTKTEKIKAVDPSTISSFARMYDDGNIGWTKDPQANLNFLKMQEAAATKLLQRQGYLFLNDVYEMLGFPKTKEGQVAGWIFDEKNPEHKGDNFVDLGIFNTNIKRNVDFVNGYERVILLDFNIDGNILDFMK